MDERLKEALEAHKSKLEQADEAGADRKTQADQREKRRNALNVEVIAPAMRRVAEQLGAAGHLANILPGTHGPRFEFAPKQVDGTHRDTSSMFGVAGWIGDEVRFERHLVEGPNTDHSQAYLTLDVGDLTAEAIERELVRLVEADLAADDGRGSWH